MFYIIYNNQTKKIAEARTDESTGNVNTLDIWFNSFIKVKKVSANDYSIVETVEPENKVSIVRDMYDVATNTIYPDPNYIEPSEAIIE
jgi:hypothetical protein